MRQKIILIVFVWASLTCSWGEASHGVVAGAIQRIPSRSPTGAAAAVRVADGTWVFTGQVFARHAASAVRSEAEAALTALDEVVARSGSDLTRAVRLCAYVADDRSVAEVEAAVARRFAAMPVAFTLVRTPLTQAGARVALRGSRGVSDEGIGGGSDAIRGGHHAGRRADFYLGSGAQRGRHAVVGAAYDGRATPQFDASRAQRGAPRWWTCLPYPRSR